MNKLDLLCGNFVRLKMHFNILLREHNNLQRTNATVTICKV